MGVSAEIFKRTGEIPARTTPPRRPSIVGTDKGRVIIAGHEVSPQGQLTVIGRLTGLSICPSVFGDSAGMQWVSFHIPGRVDSITSGGITMKDENNRQRLIRWKKIASGRVVIGINPMPTIPDALKHAGADVQSREECMVSLKTRKSRQQLVGG